MARIFDVVEYANEMQNVLAYHFPENGVADLRFGSQVIVRESQKAVFFRDGKALGVLGPGRHTISAMNFPLLTGLLGTAFNGRTPFTAEVFYVSMREFADVKWGTSQPIIVRNAGVGLGVSLLQGFGTYSFQVADPQQFITQIVGSRSAYTLDAIEGRLRTMLLSKIQDVLGTLTQTKNIFELIGLVEEIGTAVRVSAQDDFAAIGLTLKSFYIGSLKPSEKSAEELRAMGMLDMSVYTQLQAADALREAANNPSGGAGLTAGLGAGMGLGNLMTQTFAQPQAVQPAPAPAAPAASAAPSAPGIKAVMTPGEVAQLLQVSEEDIIASINAGELKARKIGSAYRISGDAVTEFLNG